MQRHTQFYLIEGSIFKTLETLHGPTYVLVFNEIRMKLIIDHIEDQELLRCIIFIKPQDLRHDFNPRLDNNDDSLLMIDEYELFKEEELWNKVILISESFNNVFSFNSRNSLETISNINFYSENIFVHHLLFESLLRRKNIILICKNQFQMESWIKVFQQLNIRAKMYLSHTVHLNVNEFEENLCCLIQEDSHLLINNEVINKPTIFTYYIDSSTWLKMFRIYHPNLSLPFYSLEKTIVWKTLIALYRLELYLKAFIHRLWEFFYV
ncbi:MAG: hypothetical protein HN576_10600 [Bacteriovoracaceae bacterium]|jgi:hypothetical protein|nr:hypothetical protein [Bacteriovoracaceae bacterium]